MQVQCVWRVVGGGSCSCVMDVKGGLASDGGEGCQDPVWVPAQYEMNMCIKVEHLYRRSYSYGYTTWTNFISFEATLCSFSTLIMVLISVLLFSGFKRGEWHPCYWCSVPHWPGNALYNGACPDSDSHVLVRGCQAGNLSYHTSCVHCVNVTRVPFSLFKGQWLIKMILKHWLNHLEVRKSLRYHVQISV